MAKIPINKVKNKMISWENICNAYYRQSVNFLNISRLPTSQQEMYPKSSRKMVEMNRKATEKETVLIP